MGPLVQKQSMQRLHHPNIKMAPIPPSAPHPLRLARPRAICHANSIQYKSGVDISPPGKMTDDTFHYTFIQLQRLVRRSTAERRKDGANEMNIGSDLSFFSPLSSVLYSAAMFSSPSTQTTQPPLVMFYIQTQHIHFTVGSKAITCRG